MTTSSTPSPWRCSPGRSTSRPAWSWAITPTRTRQAKPRSPPPATTCTPGSRSTSRDSVDGVQPHPARRPGAERPEHQAARRPEAAGAAATASAAGTRRPATHPARRPRGRGRESEPRGHHRGDPRDRRHLPRSDRTAGIALHRDRRVEGGEASFPPRGRAHRRPHQWRLGRAHRPCCRLRRPHPSRRHADRRGGGRGVVAHGPAGHRPRRAGRRRRVRPRRAEPGGCRVVLARGRRHRRRTGQGGRLLEAPPGATERPVPDRRHRHLERIPEPEGRGGRARPPRTWHHQEQHDAPVPESETS